MYLVELEGVQQIEQLAVLLGLGQFDIVLLVFVKRWLKVRGRYLETWRGGDLERVNLASSSMKTSSG